jgi:hypothetical protein
VVGSKKELAKEPGDAELNSNVRPKTGNNWARYALIVDCETTTDEQQALLFGAYRFCEAGKDGVYSCIEEGFFYADELRATKPEAISILTNYVKDNRAETKEGFGKRLHLYSRSEFMKSVFWKAAYDAEAAIVCFNAPFDLSRLAVDCRHARRRNEGWSLIMFHDKDAQTGDLREDPFKPRVKITSKDSKSAFIRFAGVSIRRKKTNKRFIPYKPGRFLDLRTLGWALRNESYNLKNASDDFGGPPKSDHEPTGLICLEEIDYCRQDVRCTEGVLNGMRREFDKHPIGLPPEQAFSPASIAKAYLRAMGVVPPLAKFPVDASALGVAMQAYYGGRAECHIRHTPVPVVQTDFRSEYPTVNTLMGLWKLLTAEKVTVLDATNEIRVFLETVRLKDCFNRDFWKSLAFFALVEPASDILPIRTLYNGRTTNIGINCLSSPEPIWYSGPDLIASTLISGRPPKIIRAIKVNSENIQGGLNKTNLRGMVAIDPRSDDFFKKVIEAREKTRSDSHVSEKESEALGYFLKILANAGSYGLFVEVNPKDFGTDRKTGGPARGKIKVFSGERQFEQTTPVAEIEGSWYCSLLAALITAGGRLLLTMLERSVSDKGGAYLMCDTDSLAIVATKKGGLVACEGGNHQLLVGQKAVRALSWREVADIADGFEQLNPYNPKIVSGILKIEKVNYLGANQRELLGYAIASKRYALFTRKPDGAVQIEKASAHGLGFLYPPKPGFDKKAGAPTWVVEAWSWILNDALGIPSTEPDWFCLPAMMRLAVTTPKVLEKLQERELALPYRDRTKPFNFVLTPILDRLSEGFPRGVDPDRFTLIAPFTKDSSLWLKRLWTNIYDGKSYRLALADWRLPDEAAVKTYGEIIREYRWHRETKSLGPNGEPCDKRTSGLLQRASITVGQFRFIGKETDRQWEHGDHFSLLERKGQEYREGETKHLTTDAALQAELSTVRSRSFAKLAAVSEGTVKAAKRGRRIRRATAKKLWNSVRKI